MAVPLFFMLSGATFFRDYKKGMYKKKLASRVKSLIVPYIIWNIVWMCFDIVCTYTPVSRFFLGREKFLITLPNIIGAIFFYRSNGVFWFIYDLIVFVVLTPLFDLLTANKRRAYLFTGFTLFLPLFASKAFRLVRLDASAVVFYAIGCLIGKYYFNDFIRPSTTRARGVCGGVCLICAALQMLDRYEVIMLHMIARQILLIAFCIAFWKVMDCVAERIEVRPFMYTSFMLYAVHGNLEAVIVKVIYLLGPKEMWMGIPNYIVSYCATILLICVFALALKKYSPKVYAVITGER